MFINVRDFFRRMLIYMKHHERFESDHFDSFSKSVLDPKTLSCIGTQSQ